MSLQLAAQHLSHQGRFGDSTLVHMSPVEVAALQKLAEKHGMSLTINPETGLPEAFSLKKLLPAIIGFGLNMFAPGIGSAIGSALGTSAAVGTGLAVGGFEALRTGDLGRGLMAGLGAYGGASLGAGLSSLGSSAAENAAILAQTGGEEATGQILQEAARKGAADFAAQPFMDRLGQGVSAAINSPSALAQSLGGNKELMKTGLALAAPIVADEAVQTTTKMPTSEGYLRPYVYDPYTQGLTAMTPVSNKDAYAPPSPPGGKSGGLAAALAGGGAVAFADGGSSFVIGGGSENPRPKSDPPVPTQADKDAFYVNRNDTFVQTRVGGSIVPPEFEPEKPVPPDVMKDILEKMANRYDPMTHEKFSDQWKRLGITDPLKSEHLQNIAQGIYNKQLLREKYFGSGGGGGTPNPNQPDPNTPDPNRPDPNTPDPNRPDPNTPTPINPIIPAPPPPPPYVRPDPFDPGKVPIDRLPTIEQKKPEDVMSGESLNAYLALMGKGSTATKQWDTAPMRPYLPGAGQSPFFIQRDGTVTKPSGVSTTTTTPVTPNLTNPAIYPSEPAGPGMEWYYDGSKWAKRPMTEINAAAGGGLMAAYADGGASSLGGYSDGGRLLRGPGDGVSDSIPATIADRRPARLADGEFVVPARIVSELGNGSTEAGARKLYAMMDRVQKARGKTTGKGRVAVNSRADKHLPA